MSDETKLSRRGFVKGAGLAASAAMLIEGVAEGAAAAKDRKQGPGPVDVTLDVNDENRRVAVEPRATLVSVLRDQLGLTGTKVGCDRAACGACTVMLGDLPVPSCSTFVLDAVGQRITTIEGLAQGERLAPIQAAFVAHDALQCGFCTPGMVMSCHALLQKNAHPTEQEVRQAVSGNLCRCGTYPKVFEAELAAAGTGATPIAPAQGDLPPRDAGKSQEEAPAGGDRKLQVGVSGALSAKERKVPEGEPRPWDGSAQLRVVGQKVPRIEGPEKVTGRARYCFDVQLPRMLHAVLVRSPHAHARIKSVDVSAAEKMPGVMASYVLERILGPAELRLKPKSKEKYPRVRYEGQPVAAVAALTLAQAEDAARAVSVAYEVLPHAADIDEAQKEGAPLVFEGPTEQPSTAGGGGATKGLPQKGNVRGPNVTERGGDVEQALASSAVVHEAVYRPRCRRTPPSRRTAWWRIGGTTA